jgi:hypothetical protein
MQIVLEQHAVDYDGRGRSGGESDVPLGSLDLTPPRVTNNHIKDGERLAQLEVWAQNGNREVTP